MSDSVQRPRCAVSLVADGVVRIRYSVTGTFTEPRSWSPVDLGVLATARDAARFTSVESGKLTVLDPDNDRVVVSAPRRPQAVDDGVHWFWSMPEATHYYGFGERTGLLDKRGRRYSCWTTDRHEDHGPATDELYVAIPFFMAVEETGYAYGVFLGDTHRTAFDLTAINEEQLTIETARRELDQYVVLGPTPDRVVERFTRCVGRVDLPPRWALGHHHGRFGYDTAERICAVAEEFRTRRIPCDAIHIDIDNMDGYRVFTWDNTRFADPPQLIEDLRGLGLRTLVFVDPGVKKETHYHVYDEGVARDAFVRRPDGELFSAYVWPGECVYPDFARQDVREWWTRLHEPLCAIGISGVVNDMNEPAMRDRPLTDPDQRRVEPPPDSQHGPSEERVPHAEFHNVYGLLACDATGAALERFGGDERPLQLTRAGSAGVQRRAAVWTGDNGSYWEHLEMSLPQLLNLGLSGVPFAGADVGGFFADCSAELLVRWYQLGACYPFMRNHAGKGCTPQEPWVWGPDVEAACRRMVEWRMRLLPYLYTCFHEAAQCGTPILRPLVYDFPDDPAVFALHDEALLGPNLLVAPILRPGRRARSVYLPAGRWCDLRTGEWFDGRREILARGELDELLPAFGRGGTIVPLGPVIQHAGEYRAHDVTLDVFPDRDGYAAGTLYEDDGISFAYRDGDWRTTGFTYRRGDLTAETNGAYGEATPTYRFEVR